MIIKKLKLKNIRSYESEEIEFPYGSMVLAGDIGAGKTSVLLAIEFALFGLQPGQKGSSLLRNGQEEGFVSITIEVDNKEILIERGLKRKKDSVTQVGSRIKIEGNSEELSTTELKNKVLSILNYPKEFAKKTNILYRFTVYTPQEEMKQIILEKPEARLDTLRHIFGIDKYKKIKENTKILVTKLRGDIRDYEGQIRDLEEIKKNLESKKQNLEKLSENIILIEQDVEKKKKQRQEFEDSMKDVQEKINEKIKHEQESGKTRVMLAGKIELISSLENEIDSISRQITEAKKTEFSQEYLDKLKQEFELKEKDIEEKSKNYIEILSRINSIKSKISDFNELKERISSIDLCPTCLQRVDEGYKKNILRTKDDEILKNSKLIEKQEQEKSYFSEMIENLKKEKKGLEETISELEKIKIKLENIAEKEARLEQIKKQKLNTEKDKQLLEKQIKTLNESVSFLKKYENIFETKKKHFEQLKNQEKEKEIELEGYKKEKELTIKNIEEIEQNIESKIKIKIKLNTIQELEFWLNSSFINIIGHTERNIMIKLREEFSKLFNEWFNILVPEIFTVRLDEDFTPIIEQGDYQLDYNFLSGGERTAIALAYRLSLNQVINSLLSKIKTRNLVILDEPTDGFSEQQLDKIRDVLDELEKVEQLIIVSHEAKIESFVENVIKFKKQDGITKIER